MTVGEANKRFPAKCASLYINTEEKNFENFFSKSEILLRCMGSCDDEFSPQKILIQKTT